MKKLFNLWLIFLAVFLGIGGFSWWLLATNQGARFVINTAIGYIPASVEASAVKGRLAGGLQIEEIRIRTKTWDVSAKRLYLRWNPFHLLGGWVGIREISIDELSINDLLPEVRNPYDLSWPHARGFLSWIKARIKLFQVSGISYKEAGREISRTERLRAQIIWYLGGLNIRSLLVKSSLGLAEGSIGGSFTKPALSVNVQIAPEQSYYGLDTIDLSVRLESGEGGMHLSGPMILIGKTGNSEQVKLAGVARMSKDKIVIDNMELKEMGRRGTINGSILVDVSYPQRPYEVNLTANDLALTEGSESTIRVSGTLSAKGDVLVGYKGSFNLRNAAAKPWKEISLNGLLQGDRRSMRVSEAKGSVLGGGVDASFQATWMKNLRIEGKMEARNLDPARMSPDWPGVVNADLFADLTFTDYSYPEGSVKANFLRSTIRKRPLTGTIDARWAKGRFSLARGELHGKGFDVSAHGDLHDKIDYRATIEDLGGLIPGASGRLLGSGWFRLKNDRWRGVVKGEGNAMKMGDFTLDSLVFSAQMSEKGDDGINGRIQARNVARGQVSLGSPSISVDGKISGHDVIVSMASPKGTATVTANGGYKDGTWSGTVTRIDGKDVHAGPFRLERPVALSVSTERLSLTPLIISGSTGEMMELAGDVRLSPAKGSFALRWDKINLARANQFLRDVTLEGLSSGSLEGNVLDKERTRLTGSGVSSLVVRRGSITFHASSTTKLTCDEKGIKATWNVGLGDGGKIVGQFVSTEPVYLKRPESGEMKIVWRDVNIDALKPWLPPTVDVKGRLSGAIHGKLAAGSRFEISGDAKITGGSLAWRSDGGIITSSAENASMDFNWKDEAIKGNVDVRFPSHGRANGGFSVPVPARFPLTVTKTGDVQIRANGEIREKGIVSSLFPGLVEESRGQLTFEVMRQGTWEVPDVKGQLRLQNAAAYLPGTGTRLKDVAVDATFVRDRIELTSFTAKSGPGKIHGFGTFWLKDLGMGRFKAKVGGDRFQAVYLPELQVLVNPDLTLEGEGKKILVTGKVHVPEALLRDGGSKTTVRTSGDVVVVDAPQKEKKPLKVDVDIQATVSLGEKVRMQVGGLDGRLEGSVHLTGNPPEKFLGKGMVKIIDGKYNSYGIKLDVTRGNIIFDDGPIERSTLDIMATRIFNPGKFDEIKAGVTVTGTPLSPLIKLYSDPPMTDTDVLSYMVLGRPIKAGSESNQTALLLKSASAALGTSKPGGIQDQLQQLLGLDTLDVQEGPKSSYASSRTTATSSSTLDNSLMTVGKYLSPDLYVSYGRSLFADQFLISARYNVSKRVELESKTGMATSVDLFYKIEFD